MSALDRLALRAGIEPEFQDAAGEIRRTTPEVARTLLRALGFDASDEEAAQAALERIEQEAGQRPLPPVLVTTLPGGPLSVPLNAPTGAMAVRWEIVGEDGMSRKGEAPVRRAVPGSETGGPAAARHFVVDAPDTFGRARLRVEGEGVAGSETTLVVAPRVCWVPEALNRERRIWGIALQLYLLRSACNWGVGDFGDLKAFVDVAADLGADVVGLNPLHAMFHDDPEHASPYSPASRLFLNLLYIDVTAVPGFDDPATRAVVDAPAFQERLAACRSAALVDYEGVARLKLAALEAIHRGLGTRAAAAEGEAFAAFRREGGEPLERFCRFLALREHFAARNPERADWRHWPEPYRDCCSEAVESFAAERRDRVDFFAWTQWIADGQLAEAAALAEKRGMAVGLYRDLAVGADAGGAETWSNPRAVLSSVQVGAPPDILNPAGQNWGLPAFDPRALREEAYESFSELVRSNMRHAGGLRIDHVMALQHLYLIPEGHPSAEGAYVAYALDELVSVLALESGRQRCLVVGEDLGTVPEGFRERMAEAKVLSYRVLFFERDEDGVFVPPDSYPALALAVLGSHDLATLRGWWEARDIQLKARHGLYVDEDQERQQRDERQAERVAFVEALEDAGLVPAGEISLDDAFGERLADAAHAFLAATRSGLAVAQLDDLLDEADQVNLPGTVGENPNWRRRHAVSLEEIRTHPRVRALAGILGDARGAGVTTP